MSAQNGDLLGPAGEALAAELERADDVPSRRHEFFVPDGVAYLAGNSLGLQPRAAATAIDEVLAAWARSAVDAHVEGDRPWIGYHNAMRESVAGLVGANPGEAVVMNSLTVNLHLMASSFYRPTSDRHRVVIEADVFPSDRYAITNMVRARGLDPDEAVVILQPRAAGERHLRTEDIADFFATEGSSVALAVFSAVDFRIGAFLDMPAITEAAHDAGALIGWDLAHAAGNVPMRLHDWAVDFAFWCHYKYVNAGPGAVGGAFVHERHGNDPAVVRPGGWWGHDGASRFAMPFEFKAIPGAEGWQVSNPPILAMAPVRVALDQFNEIGMEALRERSIRLTGFLERLLDEVATRRPITIVTPRQPERRGAQLSVMVDDAAAVAEAMFREHSVRTDDRPPNIVRIAPTPLYNTYLDCWRAAVGLDAVLAPVSPTVAEAVPQPSA